MKKACKVCGRSKASRQFKPQRRICLKCWPAFHAQEVQNWRGRNPNELRARARTQAKVWRKANPGKSYKAVKKYRKRHPEKAREIARQHRERHPLSLSVEQIEKRRLYNREYARKRRAAR